MGKTKFLKIAATALVGTLLMSGAAQSEATLDAGAFQKIIKNQMSAFASNNARAAFSYATSTLQQRFKTPEFFMEMVRQGYQPVYQPRSVTFGQSKMTKIGPTQEVFVTGPKGKDWLALYTFEQEEDGSWRISGCFLKKADNFSA
ncbi:MAG: DUF4864 domain-containing protein [Roseibium sp.]|uniref:DUF4864 domain-containing protein n=1 Tax=Roseibium sp. TaxID=1936156 RepID=UPI001B227E0A|nr:DUF4864 domain-containing protein [Roseibium sp.]MBO6893164.1 DUF4864 domain-containing protein [Roseibium sp.]MBO6932804.1 DUF4864 domain-containing protein [Roseibium sp.]